MDVEKSGKGRMWMRVVEESASSPSESVSLLL